MSNAKTPGRKMVEDLVNEVDYDIYKELDFEDPNIQAFVKAIDALYQRDRILSALEGCGVDNWEGWDIAMEMIEED